MCDFNGKIREMPTWRNGRRSRLKICFQVTGVRVRVPPSVFFSASLSAVALARLVGIIVLLFSLASGGTQAVAEVVIPGLVSSQLDAQLKGQVLIEETNCVACHAGSPALAETSKKAPRLASVGSRVNPYYLAEFIRNPHGTKAGTTMPDVLSQLKEEERDQAATELLHFLLSQKPNDFDLQVPDAVAASQGERLFRSRGCAACHSPRNENDAELLPQSSVPLGSLEKKYSIMSLAEFLRQPHASRPSGRMPDMRLSGRDLECITHYLLRETRVPGHLDYTMYRGQVWEGLTHESVEPERAGQVADFSLENLGKIHHHMAVRYEGWLNITQSGRYTFFLQMNGGSLEVDGKPIIQEDPKDRRGMKQLQGSMELATGWRKLRLIYFHTGRDPSLMFEMEGPGFARQAIPASMLSTSVEPIPAFEPIQANAELATRGRKAFGKLGCASCHDDLGVPSAAATHFSELDPTRGCLSETSGPWPRFDLSTDQSSQMAQAISGMGTRELSDEEQLHKTLVTFNCIACHDRAGLGGIANERKTLFTGTAPALGDQGRLPPPLTHVGAKLTPEWIAEVLLRGQRQRDYLDAAMPQFGEANVGHLVDLFGKIDHLEEVTFPTITNLEESKDAGYEMIGVTGFSCIACHDFNGQKSVGAGALDLVHTTERIQKNWFHLYMRQPSRFHPTVIMPNYWPGGQSIRPTILDGDPAQQIEALWTYLESGTQARKPLGLSRQSNELRVFDVAEICRGRGTAGFRGIGVGYSGRINLAFDSEEMALRELWKGEFANVNFGSFHPRGTDRISFPPGIPFHDLKSLDDSWPFKGKTNHGFPQDHGYQFRGYHLDEMRRPTFRYHYREIEVEEFFEDVVTQDGNAYFKRTFQFEAAEPQEPFYFRAACGRKVSATSDQVFVIDRLQLRLTSDHAGILREGDPGEILVPLTLPKGISTLTLEYQW